MKKVENEIKKDGGHTMIAGDFNCVTDITLDKRGGRINSGTTGTAEQKRWEKIFNLVDVWRKQHPNDICTIWSNGVKNIHKII